MKKTPFILSILFVVLVIVIVSMVFNGDEDLDVVSGNGRIEATEIGISAKVAGRVEEIYVREGDMVSAGDVVAKLDTSTINSQLQQAKAQRQQTRSAVDHSSAARTPHPHLHWCCHRPVHQRLDRRHRPRPNHPGR